MQGAHRATAHLAALKQGIRPSVDEPEARLKRAGDAPGRPSAKDIPKGHCGPGLQAIDLKGPANRF